MSSVHLLHADEPGDPVALVVVPLEAVRPEPAVVGHIRQAAGGAG